MQSHFSAQHHWPDLWYYIYCFVQSGEAFTVEENTHTQTQTHRQTHTHTNTQTHTQTQREAAVIFKGTGSWLFRN